MDELIKLVSKKAGISETQAKSAVDTVLKFLKEKLPDPVAGRLDDIVSGAGSLDLGKGMDALGGLLGGKKK